MVAQRADWHVSGADRWQEGMLLLCWHGQLFLGAALLERLGRAPECIAPIVMDYPGSGTMARFATAMGVDVIDVPGYEQPDRREAKLQTLLPPLRAGYSVFMAADGHRAPSRVVASDTVSFAATCNVPLLPVALNARPALTLPTWDRKQIPLPNSRIVAVIGEAIPGKAASAERVAARLEQLAGEAAQQLA